MFIKDYLDFVVPTDDVGSLIRNNLKFDCLPDGLHTLEHLLNRVLLASSLANIDQLIHLVHQPHFKCFLKCELAVRSERWIEIHCDTYLIPVTVGHAFLP
jgi:hypothetical protein